MKFQLSYVILRKMSGNPITFWKFYKTHLLKSIENIKKTIDISILEDLKNWIFFKLNHCN